MGRPLREDLTRFAAATARDLVLGCAVIVLSAAPHLVAVATDERDLLLWHVLYLLGLAFLGGVVGSMRPALRPGLWPLLILFGFVIGEALFALTGSRETAPILHQGFREAGPQLLRLVWFLYLSMIAGGGLRLGTTWFRARRTSAAP